jgi:hypothetical protein
LTGDDRGERREHGAIHDRDGGGDAAGARAERLVERATTCRRE